MHEELEHLVVHSDNHRRSVFLAQARIASDRLRVEFQILSELWMESDNVDLVLGMTMHLRSCL